MPKWLLLSLLTLIFWGIWAVIPKFLPTTLSGIQSQTLSTVGLLPVLVFMAFSWWKKMRSSSLKSPLIAFAAGLLGAVGNVIYYDAMSASEKAAAVVPLTALYPLVTILLALVFLGERPSLWQGLGIVLALAAIYAFNPMSEGANLGASGVHILALLPIVLWGVAGVLQKLCTQTISGETACFWFLSAFIPVAAQCVFRDASLSWSQTPKDWMLLAGLGLTYALGNWLLLAAFAAGGKASVVTPLSGLYSVVALGIAVFVLKEKLGTREIVGIVLSILAVVSLSIERGPAVERSGKE